MVRNSLPPVSLRSSRDYASERGEERRVEAAVPPGVLIHVFYVRGARGADRVGGGGGVEGCFCGEQDAGLGGEMGCGEAARRRSG